ncbi:MAG: bifunctional 4-hydroxy-2-oxoglutarate aldolase/2-dehydro-3-deoxy-phosphogluconate aldolase [Clostridia bacterium]|nr:bifunctional 4-hydroxy-2-oxoglutarate aldolase/2-dehydro-3-deoxy-phosphogluconate aldolase [Clostridia bacterium]
MLCPEKCVDLLALTKIVPVITPRDPADAPALARALAAGGLRAAEITFRSDAAADTIAAMREAEPELLVGAGTVLTESALEAAASAGAQFIVTPGLNPRIGEKALGHDLPYFPGVMTPTEIEAALALGLRFLKFFPAEAAGGVKMLKAFAGPYPMVRFMPTGGITAANARAYLALPNVFCCGGSFIADGDCLARGDFAEIERRARAVSSLLAANQISL